MVVVIQGGTSVSDGDLLMQFWNACNQSRSRSRSQTQTQKHNEQSDSHASSSSSSSSSSSFQADLDLEINQVTFDSTLASSFIDLLMNIENKKESKCEGESELKYNKCNDRRTSVAVSPWKSIRLIDCHGPHFINDVIMACFTPSLRLPKFEFVSHQFAFNQVGVNNNINNNNNIIHRNMEYQEIISNFYFAISYGLKYCKGLKHLKLSLANSDFQSRTTHQHADSLARAIARNTWLETLDLTGSFFDASAIGPLSFGLRINRSITKLVLDGCYMEDDQIATILLALQDHPNLATLSLQQNSCHTEGMGAIASLLHYNTALLELDLSYLIRKKKDSSQKEPSKEEEQSTDESAANEESKEVDDESKQELNKDQEVKNASSDDGTTENSATDPTEDKNKTNPKDHNENNEDNDHDPNRVRNVTLKNFQLAGNGLTDQYVQSLLRIFPNDGTCALEELNLFGNRITDHGVKMIIRKLSHLPNLKTLWLGQNVFTEYGGVGAQDLVNTVQHNNYNLERINVRSFFNRDMDPLQQRLDYYGSLNQGGRRIFGPLHRNKMVPLSLWPLVFEFASRTLTPTTKSTTTSTPDDHDDGDDGSHPAQQEFIDPSNERASAADVIYCLLHGPVLFENPHLSSL